MLDSELVSIIMSTYNESNTDLKRAIQSILQQSYENFEYIIVLDNPENETIKQYLSEVAALDHRIKIILNEENIGLTESLNKAIAQASGSFIARMDADDYSLPERIEKQLAYLHKNCLDLVGCYVECVDEKGETIYFLKKMPVTNEEIGKKICINNPIAHPTWLGKKEIFLKNSGYRNIPYAEDYDFLLRAYSKGYKFGNLNEVLFQYTLRETSISKSNGLKQYLVAKELVKAYKNRSLDECTNENICKCFATISELDQSKFANAANYFALAAKKIENNNPLFIFYVCKAMMNSKYYTGKIIMYVKSFL